MFPYLIRQTLLSLSPVLRFAFKESGFNETIEPIFVKLIKTVLDLAVLRLQSRNRLIPEAFLICMAF